MAMPSSSPRLPSPPPTAENQMSPGSPSGNHAANWQGSQVEQGLLEANSKRRVHRGTKAANISAGPPLMPLSELDSAFQLQEHLAALHYHHTKGRNQPITRSTAVQLATPPSSTDRTLWLYELCRFLVSQCNSLIVGFLFDTPPCSAATCPEMRASEWQFLCAVHEEPKNCCAIDYCCHTLDWAANVVTDQKIFPSRFVALEDTHNKNVAMKNLVNVFRRLHRMLAHAWFQHRSVFWSVESQTGLYVFFKTVCDMYDLIPGETYKLPPEAAGLEPEVSSLSEPVAEMKPTLGAAPPFPPSSWTPIIEKAPETAAAEEDHGVGRTNTRRHIRSNPSTGSAVTTVLEADEEEGAELARKTRELYISGPPGPLVEAPEAEEVPDAVEDSATQESAAPVDSPTDDVETPVQTTAGAQADDASGDRPNEAWSAPELESTVTSEAPAAGSQVESLPVASEPEPASADEPTTEAVEAENSASLKEKSEGETRVEEPASKEAEEDKSASNPPVPEPEAPGSDDARPADAGAAEVADQAGATGLTPDAKSDEEPKE